MQHHVEEFSVADVRHTLAEVLRVVSGRRWYFLFPFFAVATMAFLASHWVPRKYSATTVIKREHDPVLAGMMGRSWTEPYTEIGQRMVAELTNPILITHVLADLDLPEGSSRFDNGELTPASQEARTKLADLVALGLTTKSLEASPNRDVVSLSLVLTDRRHQTDILRCLRDKYMAQTKKRTIEVLRGMEAFLVNQSERSRTELADLQKKLVELELKFPGIDPAATDPTKAQETALTLEKVDFERRIESAKTLIEQLADRLAHSCLTANGPPDGRPVRLPQAPNTRYFELRQQIEKIERDIADAKAVRMMTDAHPAVIELNRSLAVRRFELVQTPTTIDRRSDATTAISANTLMLAVQNAELQLSEAEAKLQTAEARLHEISDRVAKIQDGRVLAAGQRDEYLGISQKADRVREELTSWQQNLGPIRRVVTLESGNRGIHFTTVQEMVSAPRPNSPDALIVIVACLAIGVAVGGLVVLLAELFDRSFQTVKHLSTTLGIPVIESIDEILTQSAHRQRMIRRLVTLPIAVLVLMTVMSIAGLMAFLSLQNPIAYERVKSSPTSVIQVLMEQT